MLARKVLLVLNVVVGIVLAAALGAAWWFVGRPSPQTSGEVVLPLNADVQVLRDERGIPLIRARSVEDAMFAQGFVTAQERLWQMDALRRLAAGELSEIVGEPAAESDTMARKLRMGRIAEAQLAKMSGEELKLISAYARGVNAYIEHNRGRWGWEFAALRYEPRPWRPLDSLLVMMQMNRTLSTSWEQDLLKYRMMAGGDPMKVDRLFPVRMGGEGIAGSNGWVISGRFSASGKPILCNDPHLEHSMPSVWFVVRIEAPGYHVAGGSLTGLPGVVIGHNENIAWGITSLEFDAQDLYIEHIDTRTGRYDYKGETRVARAETERIAIRDSKPLEILNWVTVHGPLFTADDGRQMSLRWAAAEDAPFALAIFDVGRARNWTEFRSALSRFSGPGLNFVYADREGHIGLQVAGRVPRRKTFDGDLPLEGWTGANEWDGLVGVDELPSAFDPPSGVIVTANQNSFPMDEPYRVNGRFASPYRAVQIRHLLNQGSHWKPEQMLTVQKDVYSAFDHFLAKQAIEAVRRQRKDAGDLKDAIAVLEKWNGQMEVAEAAPVLTQMLYRQLRSRLAENAAPKFGPRYSDSGAPAAIESLLRQRPAGWFANWDQEIAGALDDAVEEGRRRYGKKITNWTYGRVNEWTISHPIAARVPTIAPLFSIGPAPMSGSGNTVKQISARLGPSMRFIADLSNWDQSLLNIVTGESGHVLSGHYRDQWEAYYNGTSFPFVFSHIPGAKMLLLRAAGDGVSGQ